MQKNLEESETTSRRAADWIGLLIIAAATVYLSVAVLNARPLQSANDRSRWCTVWSLAERGTYQIDEIDAVAHWSTIDKVRHRLKETEPYHFYSSKPPLFPTMVAGLYWLEKHTIGFDLLKNTATVTRFILFIVNVVPMVLALLALRAASRQLHISPVAVNLLLAAAAFASMLNPFMTTLNNHTPAAICLLFSLAALIRLRTAVKPAGSDFAIVGLTAALTCCFELPAALFGLLSFVVVVLIDRKKTATWYVPAALIPLAAFFITNWICTGGIKPFYTYYGTEKYEFIHEGIPSYWMEPKGIDANTESTPVYLFHCVLGHHGLLSLTPIFFLTLAGWVVGLRSKVLAELRTVWILGALISVVVLVFYLTRTQNYNYGGNSSALRWMLWLTPFWWFGMLPVLDRLARSRTGLLLFGILFLPSVYSAVYSRNEPWRPNWIFVQMENAGWIDYRTKVLPFDPPRFALLNQLPPGENESVLFQTTSTTESQALVLTAGKEFTMGRVSVRPLTVSLQKSLAASPSTSSIKTIVIVDVGGPVSGSDISTWIKSADGTQNGSKLSWEQLRPAPTWVTSVLRGMPSPRKYNAASPRYFQYTNTAGNKTAIKCERAASRVAFNHPEFGRCWHRCDVYYSSKVPFGVVYWMITVTQEKTDAIIRTEHWTCTALP